jgi:hypothetical protein
MAAQGSGRSARRAGRATRWPGVLVAVMGVAGCGGSSGSKPSDARPAGDGTVNPTRRQLIVVPTDVRGVALVGAPAIRAELLVIDARSQRPIEGSLVQALPEKDGYFVRVSKDDQAVEPTVAFVRAGQRVTVPVGPSTADVQAQAVRGRLQVGDQDLLSADADLKTVAALAERENRATVVFLPPPGEAEQSPHYAVYRSMLPGTLLAVGGKPGTGMEAMAPVAAGRAVAATGARRAGLPVDEALLQQSAPGALDQRNPPLVGGLTVTPPSDQGAATLSWRLDDPDRRVAALEVGVDTTNPDKRIAATATGFAFTVARGAHFACVRPQYPGAENDSQTACVSFDATSAPAAANVRVRVTPMAMDSAPAARRPIPVEVEVENVGQTPAAAFDVAVVLSRDGSIETGLGELRVLPVDGLGPGEKAVRKAYLTPPYDGAFYLTAKADVGGQLREGNARDNLSRAPVAVMPAAGATRAPVVSFMGSAAGATSVPAGQSVRLSARAVAAMEGDISTRIGWISSLDGELGLGPRLDSPRLSPGVHKIAIRVASRPAAAQGTGGRPGPARLEQAASGTEVAAETTIEVVDPGSPTNSPPLLSAGPDLKTLAGVAVTPVATASDPDGDRLTFRWTATDAAGAAVEVGNATSLAPSFSASAPGTYRLAVSASDGKTAASDSLTVTVLSLAENHLPRVTVTLPDAGKVGAALAAQVTGADEDMDPLTFGYRLERPAGSNALLRGGETQTPSFVPDVPGSYRLTVTVDDGRGGRDSAQAAAGVEGVALTDAGVPPTGKANGMACATAAECASGSCEQGVCCGGACGGSCVSCALPGREGTCSVLPAGTGCTPAQCVGGAAAPARACDGTGVCGGAGTTACAPYACGGTDCLTTCTGDTDCQAPATCRGGSCVAGAVPDGGPLDAAADATVLDAPVDAPAPDAPPDVPAPDGPLAAVGAACAGSGECASGVCAQGVCCASACTGFCQSCALAGTAGTCTPVPAGQDPLGQCPDDGAASCGRDGTCNGAGACRFHVMGTTCGAAACAGTMFFSSSACDGAGSCRPAGATECAPGTCTPGGCATPSPDGGATVNDGAAVTADALIVGGSCVGGCATGSICCGSRCTDPRFDVNNCGGCGLACTGGRSCQNGTCGCSAMQVDCNGTCRFLSSDPDNCGDCGRVCPSGTRLCSGNSCQSCEVAGLAECGSTCVDLRSDALHCGSCTTACGKGEACVSSRCVPGNCGLACGAGTVCCGTTGDGGAQRCNDLRSDPSNCGGCGLTCAPGQSCQNGVCGCNSMQTDCKGTCRTTGSDPDNCGACDRICPVDLRFCAGGSCQPCSSAGQVACNGSCVDTTSDQGNCGSCGKPCQPGQACSGGMCVASSCALSCQPGSICCGGGDAGGQFCTDPRFDRSNCGGCGITCAAGQTCQSGRCGCDAMQTDCGGVCRLLLADPDNCGMCGNVCPAGSRFCGTGPSGGPTCQSCATINRTECNGACVDTTSDSVNCGGCDVNCGPNHACVGSSCVSGQAQ